MEFNRFTGDYKIRIVIDSNDLIQESNELNNELIIDFSIVETENEEIESMDSEGIIDSLLQPYLFYLDLFLLVQHYFLDQEKFKNKIINSSKYELR